jgi:regulator of protease activity HflC (stomatin/prohibitin superfamily)
MNAIKIFMMATRRKELVDLSSTDVRETEPLLVADKLVADNAFRPVNVDNLKQRNQVSTELTIDDVVIRSTLQHSDPNVQIRNILHAFNGNNPSIMEESIMFGTRIKRDEFRLVHRNNTPELVGFTETPLRKKIYSYGTTEDISVHKTNDLIVGAHGVYLVNVPVGCIAKAFYGNNQPILLAEGPHVIHNATFRLDKDAVYSLNSEWISHKPVHILRVPKAKIAKVWLGNEPHLLESRNEPYIFNTPYFSVVRKSDKELFFDASSEVLIHGSIKRLMPKVGTVAVTYLNGNLRIYAPNANNEPILITNPTHVFDSFLSTNIQTMVFPSDETKEIRKKERPNDADYINYECLITRDSLRIGVKLLLVFRIADPNLTLSLLNKDQIKSHIENVVVADLIASIQRLSSAEFLCTDITKPMPNLRDNMVNSAITNNEAGNAANDPNFIRLLSDSVKNKLASDFNTYGIELLKVNLETPKVLDQNISAKMAEYSLLVSETNSKEAVIDKKNNIARKEAQILAAQNDIKQSQENNAKINAAKASLEAARMAAEATMVTANAEAAAATAVAEAKAKLFEAYPKLFEYEMAKLQATAMANIKSTVISPEVAKGLVTFGSTYPFGNLNRNGDN